MSHFETIGEIWKEIKKSTLDQFYEFASEHFDYDSFTFELQPLNSKRKWTKAYYKNYFKIDPKK